MERLRPLPHPDGPGPSLDEPGPGREPTVSELVRRTLVLVRRRRWTVAGTWAAFVAAALLYALLAVPTYTAEGAVQVSSGSPMAGIGPLADLFGGGVQSEVQTEVEIMRRPAFVLDVLHELRLQVVDPDEPEVLTTDLGVSLGGASPVAPRVRAVRASLSAFELDPEVFEIVPLVVEVDDRGTIRLAVGAEEEAVEAAGRPGERIVAGPVSAVFERAPFEAGASVSLEVLPDGELLERYAPRIRVSALGADRDPTSIVRVAVQHTDRRTAQAVAQRLMDHYLAKTLDWQSQSASQAADFIEEQLSVVASRLSEAEEGLRDYAASHNAVELDAQAAAIIEQASEVEARRIAAKMQLSSVEAVLARFRAKGPDGAGPATTGLTANFFDDPVLAEAIGALVEAQTNYATARASLTDDHPRVQALARALVRQRGEVRKLLEAARGTLRHQVRALDAKLADFEARMRTYPAMQLELARHMRATEVNQRLYAMLLEKYEEARIVRASTTTDKRVVDAAGLPHKPTAPQRGRLLAFAGIAGLFFGIVAAAARDLSDRRLDTVEAVRAEAPFPVYGTIPRFEPAADGAEGGRRPLREIWARPHEAVPEAFRALGVAVALFPGRRGRARVVVTTSTQPGEGKSTVTANLAMSLAKAGKRVLLVDLDLRKPVQHRIWKTVRAPGYTDLVGAADEAPSFDTLTHRVEDGLTLLTAGTRLPDGVFAVMTPVLDRLLDTWRERFDFVLIDSPPAFVAETAAVADRADLLLLAVRPGTVERAALRQAVEKIGRFDVTVGLVLNAVSKHHAEDGYGAGYYYYAQSYGPSGEAARGEEEVA